MSKIEIDDSELQRKMKEKIEASKQIMRFFKSEGSKIVKGEMEIYTPVGKRAFVDRYGNVHPGFLRSGIKTRMGRNRFFVQPSAWYAAIVEKRKGFVRRTAEEVVDKLEKLVEELVEEYWVGES